MLLIFFAPTLLAYQDGNSFCRENPISGIGRFHTVIDDDFSNETISIYSYLKKPFDPNQPSLIFFPGGPGATPRGSEFDLPGINVIFFESRGMGCSRPSDPKIFLNKNFYSTEKTVQDVLQILSDYNIKKAFIYGHSYGTVSASLFASLHPEYTEKLILEGVIGTGAIGIWNSEIRKSNLQDTFKSLNSDDQNKILAFSRNGKLPSNWYSNIGTMMSYLDNGFEIYKDFLHNILTMEEDSFISFVNNFYTEKGFIATNPLDASDGEVVFGMLTCQELGALDPKASFYLNFDNNKLLQWDHDNKTKKQYCDPLQIKHEIAKHKKDLLFNSKIIVPIIYLVGENDGATDILEGTLHLKNRARGSYKFLTLERGGHLPNLGALKDDRDCHDPDDCESLKIIRTQKSLFLNLLVNESSISLSRYNEILPFKWSLKYSSEISP